MSRSLRSLFFFFFWFLWIGGANVLPQLYFIDAAPESKETWISALLALGSLVSILGFWAASAHARTSRFQPWQLLLAFVVILCSFSALFLPIGITTYFSVYLVFRFVSCFTYQRLDHLLLHEGGNDQVKAHAQAGVLYMLLGVTLGPVFFAYAYDLAIAGPVVVCLGTAALLAVIKHLGGSKTVRAAQSVTALTAEDKRFLIHCTSYLAVVYLTSSLLIYFLRDYYGLPHAAKTAGWIMLVTSGTAFLSSLVFGYLRQRGIFQPSKGNAWFVVVSMGVAIGLLYAKWSDQLIYLALCTSVMGMSYGVFMVVSRHYASVRDKQFHNGLLAVYNTLPYYATMGVFAIAGGLKLMSENTGLGFYDAIAVVVAVLLIVAVGFGVRSARFQNP